MNSPKLFAALLLATAVVVFGTQNTQAVTFHFLMFTVPSIPLVLPLFGAILLGSLLGWGVAAPGRFRGRRVRRALESQVAAHQQSDAVAAHERSDALASHERSDAAAGHSGVEGAD